jgi:hypothetical protein
MMPMSSPGWFDDFPEYLPEADYRDLSGFACRSAIS